MASYNAIVLAASVVVMDAKRSVIDDLMAYLNDKVELEDEFKSMVEEFKATLVVDKVVDGQKGNKRRARKPSEDKVKRAPSAYNLFIKDAMAKLREEYPDMSAKARLTEATQMWKKHKADLVAPAVSDEPTDSTNTPKVVSMDNDTNDTNDDSDKDNDHDDSDNDDGLKEFLQKAVAAKGKARKPRGKKAQ